MLLPVTPYGGKAKLTDEIAVMPPEHTLYVEPFAGSLSVLLAKKLETVNDLDRDLMIFWKVLRERPAHLTRVCALTPYLRLDTVFTRRAGGGLR